MERSPVFYVEPPRYPSSQSNPIHRNPYQKRESAIPSSTFDRGYRKPGVLLDLYRRDTSSDKRPGVTVAVILICRHDP